jgi:hypothetical protein
MHVHISAMSALITTAEVIVVIGTLNLLAMKFPNNSLSQSWANLMGCNIS